MHIANNLQICSISPAAQHVVVIRSFAGKHGAASLGLWRGVEASGISLNLADPSPVARMSPELDFQAAQQHSPRLLNS